MKPRYAQERHTHVGLEADAVVNGVYSTVKPTATSYDTLGTTVTLTGSTVTTTLSLSGLTPLEATLRFCRRSATTTAAGWRGQAYINTVRGFRAEWTFGTQARTDAAIFAGLFHTANTSSASFADWASVRALGITVNPSTSEILWAWRTAASTYGTVGSGVSWANHEVCSFVLEADPRATSVKASLALTTGASATHVFAAGEFPDASLDSGAVLMPGAWARPAATDTVDIATSGWWCVEPW